MNEYLNIFIKERYFVLDLQIVPGDESYARFNIGDSIALSKIPELIKKDPNHLYKKVYIRNIKSLYETQPDFLTLLYKNNPYIDGIINYPFTGIYQDYLHKMDSVNVFPISNLIDHYSYYIGVNSNIEAQNYYPDWDIKLENLPDYNNKIVLDLNGNIQSMNTTLPRISDWLKNNNIKPDFQIKLDFLNKSHFAVRDTLGTHTVPDIPIIYVSSVQEYYNILSSSKNVYCSFSGSSIFLTSIKKKFTSFVFPTHGDDKVHFQHRRMYYPLYGTYIEFNKNIS